MEAVGLERLNGAVPHGRRRESHLGMIRNVIVAVDKGGEKVV